jgi:hypothetical protein
VCAANAVTLLHRLKFPRVNPTIRNLRLGNTIPLAFEASTIAQLGCPAFAGKIKVYDPRFKEKKFRAWNKRLPRYNPRF